MLKYLFESLSVLPNELEAQNLAVILTEGSPLRDKINRAPLSERAQREWREKTTEYLAE